MPARTFLALDIDDRTRGRLATEGQRLARDGADARWVARKNLHVTLNFLGDVAAARLPDICAAAARAAVRSAAFDFSLGGLCCMPPGDRGRMIWANIDDQNGQMAQLHRALAEAMATLGFPPERHAFRGHVTLARIKRPRDASRLRAAVAELGNLDFGTQHAAEVVVYTSIRGHGGPTYIPAAHCPLATAAAGG